MLDKANVFDTDTRTHVDTLLGVVSNLTRHVAAYVFQKAPFYGAIKTDADARDAARARSKAFDSTAAAAAEQNGASTEPLGDDSDDDLQPIAPLGEVRN